MVPAKRMPPVLAVLSGDIRGDVVSGVEVSFPTKPREVDGARNEAMREFQRFFSDLGRNADVERDIASVPGGVNARFRALLIEDRTVQLLFRIDGPGTKEAHQFVGALLARHFDNRLASANERSDS
jgi:hypothetical protein